MNQLNITDLLCGMCSWVLTTLLPAAANLLNYFQVASAEVNKLKLNTSEVRNVFLSVDKLVLLDRDQLLFCLL